MRPDRRALPNGWPRRSWRFAVLAALMLAASLPTTRAVGQDTSSPTTNALGLTRISGPDAIDTAIAVSKSAFPATGQAAAVVLARSDFFADALAGGPLAAVQEGPLLITPGGGAALDPRVRAEIQRVLPTGQTVYVLGGPAALAPSIDTALAGLGYAVVRVQGANLFATAAAIAEALGNPQTIFEATGSSFADALSAVPAAVQTRGAILLTNGTTQAPETAAYLAAHPPATRYAIGGPLAAAGADPTAVPVYGQDLYDTSAAVATQFFAGATVFGVATGNDFPDALSGGVFMGTGGRSGPMLLVRPSVPVPSSVARYLVDHPSVTSGFVFGGPLAIGNDVTTALTNPSTAIWTIHSGLGFDACDVQPNASAVAKLQAWLASPYRAVGLYLGGRAAGCPTSWSPNTVNAVRDMGWRIIPIYVDLQAPCTNYNSRIPWDIPGAINEGINAANAAVSRMQALGMGVPNAPIYLDIEAYARDDECSEAVSHFVSGWTGRLHALGYLAGMYSSAASGVADMAARYNSPFHHRLDAIWFADWRTPPNPSLISENKNWLPDNVWPGPRRIRQYTGGHLETWGNVTLNIDNDNLDAPVVG